MQGLEDIAKTLRQDTAGRYGRWRSRQPYLRHSSCCQQAISLNDLHKLPWNVEIPQPMLGRFWSAIRCSSAS